MPPLDLELFTVLSRHGVPFVVVGGHAVNFHGYSRTTEDFDAVWLRSRAAEEALAAAMVEVEAQYIGDDIDPATGIERTYPATLPYIQATSLMMLVTKHGFLDLFDYIPGLPTEDVAQLFDTAITVDGVRFASLEWLRRMKRVAGRTKDLLDLEELPDAPEPPA